MMILTRWIFILTFLLSKSALCDDDGPKSMDWSYIVGSNADEIWHAKANFYREGSLIHGSSNGDAGYVGVEALQQKDYRWRIGGGRKLYNKPIPDKVDIEWISFHDKKRYGITLTLPQDLNTQLAQNYLIVNAECSGLIIPDTILGGTVATMT